VRYIGMNSGRVQLWVVKCEFRKIQDFNRSEASESINRPPFTFFLEKVAPTAWDACGAVLRSGFFDP